MTEERIVPLCPLNIGRPTVVHAGMSTEQHISIIITFCSEIIAQVDLRSCILNLRGVSLDIDRGGAEFPRKLGMGVLKFLGLKGCQIS